MGEGEQEQAKTAISSLLSISLSPEEKMTYADTLIFSKLFGRGSQVSYNSVLPEKNFIKNKLEGWSQEWETSSSPMLTEPAAVKDPL